MTVAKCGSQGENPCPRIVIVGCGISGITAAHRLIKAGFNHVRILEATSRSGGRIKTGSLGKCVCVCVCIGATYIHGPSEQNPLFCLARDYELLNSDALTPENQAADVEEHPPWVANWFSSSGQRLSAELINPAMEKFYDLVFNLPDVDGEYPYASFGQYVCSKVRQQVAEQDRDESTKKLWLCAINTLLKVQCCDNAAHSMDELDLDGFYTYKNLLGLDCTFPNGFEGLIKKLMAELPADIVTYNKPVRCVHWNNSESPVNTVLVECADGERIAADHVIVTLPLGYLKKHQSTFFSPPLPVHKLDSIHKLGFGTYNKIFVEFESPWWDADCEIIYLVWEDEDLSEQMSNIRQSWIRKLPVFTVQPPSERSSYVLCGWIAGEEAEYMETLPEQEVRRCITALIQKFTGNGAITSKRILCTRWFNDPWTCGSYVHLAIGCSEKDFENMMEPLPTKGKGSQPLQVLFAGEATHPCFYSTVHGAILTGWREADRIISHHSTSTYQPR
uniref:Peroxisomal N(1)-acetyl-spermine/spermidine oxidase-like n=1 Tax=Gouania willdenowi TaxID=441366 RepID=A0A8C5H3A2_GOUWI